MNNIIIKSTLKNISNIPGWHTRRHIIVIESDDWGSIRMPSLISFEKLENAGLNLRSEDAERYNLNDTLATTNDLEGLFNVLSSVKDKNGNHAIFSPACIVANPDFDKIKKSDFREYFYEPFTQTLKHYPGCENSIELWREGIEKKLFLPQLHGREHLNVNAWLTALKEGDKATLYAFNEGMWGFVPTAYPKLDYQAAFLFKHINEIEHHKRIIADAVKLFVDIFRYHPMHFVPPNGQFNNSLNKTLIETGIKFRYAPKIQNEPLGLDKKRRVFHFLGQKDKSGIIYLNRNCFFEPSQKGIDWVDRCLNDVKLAFSCYKPAIISSHRLNFIGSLNPGNRDTGLSQLSILLKAIVKQWPKAEFMSIDNLGKLICNN